MVLSLLEDAYYLRRQENRAELKNLRAAAGRYAWYAAKYCS